MIVFLSLGLLLLASGCGGSDDVAAAPAVASAREACVAAAEHRSSTCQRQCPRFADEEASGQCDRDCAGKLDGERSLCMGRLARFEPSCSRDDCDLVIRECLGDAEAEHGACVLSCAAGHIRCMSRCDTQRSASEEACGFQPARVSRGVVLDPYVPPRQPADLTAFLDDAELAVVEASDRAAEEHRTRRIRLWSGLPNAEIRVVQVEHAFRFGFPVDFRELEDPTDLSFYGRIVGDVASLMVAETSLKWRNTEPEPGDLRFDLADAEIAWAESNGFDVKAHVLLWGNAPPVASGSGTPSWLRDRFPDFALDSEDVAALRELIRQRVEVVVGRYSGRIDVWEVTNEMLNPLTSWFASRLGQGIVDDIFAWTREVDPGAELVYNEWISEIFTGLPGPDAAAVRDRVVELLDAGVPIDAVGQQGHFAPGLVNVGAEVDLSQRTRIDDYAAALETLAETGLPVHITEVTFAAPDDPDARAAQAEAIMRVWWGHPAVDEIIFWNFWNPLGPRSHLNLGIYGDDGLPTRHGSAILSLVEDRWRTRETIRSDANGVVELRATLGSYRATWETANGWENVRFRVGPGPGVLNVVATR